MGLKLGLCADNSRDTFSLAARIGFQGVQVGLAAPDGDWTRAAREVADQAAACALKVVAVNVPFRPGDLPAKAADLDRFCQAVASIGAPFLRGFIPPYIRQPKGQELDFWGQVHRDRRDLSLWEPILRKHGLKLCLEMHDGYNTASCSSCWILLHELDPARFGVVHDAENMVREGIEHWMKGFEILGPYLGYLHVKNMAWQPITQTDEGYWDMPHNHYKWKPVRTALPDGLVDWRYLIACLRQRQWDGWLMLEDMRQGLPVEQMWREDYAFLAPLMGL